jgi:hypothetical protein
MDDGGALCRRPPGETATGRRADQPLVRQREVADYPPIHVGSRRHDRPAGGDYGFGRVLRGDDRIEWFWIPSEPVRTAIGPETGSLNLGS